MAIHRHHLIYIFLIAVLLADFGYSFYQYTKAPLDGDLAPIVLPNPGYGKVLHDPLGLQAAIHNEVYPATNRFSAHAALSVYFKTVPLLLQSFLNPIDSVYAAAAIAKICIHILLVSLLGLYISSLFGFSWREGLLGAVLVSPFLQGFGSYTEYMGVIDFCITYVMFYALPIAILLIFLFPFYKSALQKRSAFNPWIKPVWFILMVFLVFFGPLPAPILILLFSLSLLFLWLDAYRSTVGTGIRTKALRSLKQIPPQLLLFFSITIVFCLYSLYVGTKNAENNWFPLSLADRYRLLPKGIIDCFLNGHTGLLFVLIGLSVNMLLVARFLKNESNLFFKIALFMAVFSIIYILLLPMGGYRSYRPLIIRRDTILPVLLLMYFCWGVSSIMLLKYFNKKKNYLFASYVCLISLFYFYSDEIPEPDRTNWNEKVALKKIAGSDESCVALERNCSILGWNYIDSCSHSSDRADLLHYWNITSKKTEFYQPEIK